MSLRVAHSCGDNGLSYPGGHHWNYWPDTLSQSQITVASFKIVQRFAEDERYWNGNVIILMKFSSSIALGNFRCGKRLKFRQNDNISVSVSTWWRHQMETFSALLAICAGNSPVPGEFPAQMPVTQSFDVFFDLRLNRRLSKQSWGWWLRRYRAHYDVIVMLFDQAIVIQSILVDKKCLWWSMLHRVILTRWGRDKMGAISQTVF